MTKGLVIGKFMPLHQGHLNLVEFALQNCDSLTISLCANASEPIDPKIRLQWLQQLFGTDPRITIDWVSEQLPRSKEPCPVIAEVWNEFFAARYPQTEVIFSSEKYGAALANFMKCRHQVYDPKRIQKPISATMIRENPQIYWHYIPEQVKQYYSKIKDNL